ncbi:MAG: DNA-directed RNA polymerase subunit delta [Bacilli bacterium]|nr:DNA-directed RNA polymerase subunit delta [Bacilli bacterium]
MSIRKKDLLDLELMSYTDIAYEIIKEDKKKYTTPKLFKEVCTLLQLSDEEYAEKIGDFFTALTTDGRFILLDSTNWDLKENHVVKIVVDEGDEEEIEVDSEEETENTEENTDIEDDYSDESVDNSNDDEEDMKDLTIVDEEDIIE